MDTIISVQDVRTTLGAIAKRVEEGESFTVIRNSKPAFRIVPLGEPGGLIREPQGGYSADLEDPEKAVSTLTEIQDRFERTGANKLITPEEVDQIIHEVHAERNLRTLKEE